jgi:hypothetical protein
MNTVTYLSFGATPGKRLAIISRRNLFAVAFLLSGVTAWGQTTNDTVNPTPPKPVGTSKPAKTDAQAATLPSSGVELQKVVVEGVSPEASILPNRPTDSVYGLGDTVLDTPRSVYQVSKLQLQFDPIQSSTDLARYAPSVTAVTSQGIGGVPYIRGFSAEVYQDGFRIGRTVRPFDATTSYDSLDIVPGPGSVVYGPSSKTSGYIDWTTKQPFWDKNHTEIDLTFGTWDSGGQGGHANFSQMVDNSGPIDKDLAYRVAYKQNEADSYYVGDQNNFEHLYAALSWHPSFNKDITVDWNFDYGNYDYNLTRGYNRVTQDLIDNQSYLGGTATPVLKSGATYYEPTFGTPNAGVGAFVVVTPNTTTGSISTYTPTGTAFSPGATPTGTVQGFVLYPQNATTQKIYPYTGTENPGDPVHLSQYIAEQNATFNVDSDFTILNKSYYEHDDQHQQTFDTASLQGDQADIFENRTEFRLNEDYKAFGIDINHKSNSGFDARFVDDTSVFNVSNYLINPFDLTQSLNNLTLQNLYGITGGNPLTGVVTTANYGNIALSPYYTVNGFQYPIAGTAGPTIVESKLAELGFYSFHEFKFDNQWTWSLGARLTATYASDTNPVVTPVGGTQNATFSTVHDSTWDIEPNVTTSLSYKPVPWSTLYATYNYTQALNEDSGAGGVGYGTGGQIGEAALHSDSVLYETGAKFEVIPNQLFASVAGYYQERTLGPVATGTSYIFPKVQAHGFESSINYQPNKNFNAGINYSWLEANYVNYNPNSSFGSPYGVVANGETVFSATSSSLTESAFARGNYRVMEPKNRVDLFASYQFDFGLGVRGDLWATDSYPIVNNVATIPAEFNLDLGIFYAQPKWRVQVDFLNVTDERNFALVNSDTAENIQPLEPFAVQGKFTYNF